MPTGWARASEEPLSSTTKLTGDVCRIQEVPGSDSGKVLSAVNKSKPQSTQNHRVTESSGILTPSPIEDPVAMQDEAVRVRWSRSANLRALNSFESTPGRLPGESKLEKNIYTCP